MLVKKLFLILFFIALSVNNSYADQRLTFGAKLLAANWKGDNGAGGTDFESDEGGQFGLNVAYKIGNFYTGLNLQRGEYNFKNDAPDKFTVVGRVANSNVKIQQTDVDLLFGYYFWSQVSLFIDIKNVTNNWLDEPYKQDFTGLGLGASGYIPVNDKWTIFGSFGFIAGGEIKNNNDKKVGEGTSWALEVGTVYTINERNFVNAGIKTRNYSFEYLDSSKQEYDINALFIGYNYSFSL
ncbi:MAG: hypothetical protein BMS9Abin31_1218 [Gammaproteobacteria bacterium]|nr:MAG: hypothetical protein BMS9Abin31_1218 [Gammaproteobacteria bacterium]